MTRLLSIVSAVALCLSSIAFLRLLRERRERHSQDMRESETERRLALRERTVFLVLTVIAVAVLLAVAVAFLTLSPSSAGRWPHAGAVVALTLAGSCVRSVRRHAVGGRTRPAKSVTGFS